MENKSLSFSRLPRCRWNVIDLVTMVAGPTTPGYIFCDIDTTAAEQLRSDLAARNIKVTITAILLKAIALAQVDHPESRTIKLPWGTKVTLSEPIAGFTVERYIGKQPAVFFAVLPAVHKKALGEIASELGHYGNSEICDVPQLKKETFLSHFPWLLRRIALWLCLAIPPLRSQLNAATFGMTSLGKMGLQSRLSPCVTTCIFGVGTVEPRAVVIDNEVKIRKMMTVTVSVDTSIINLHIAERFLTDVKNLMECGLGEDSTEFGQVAGALTSVSLMEEDRHLVAVSH